VKMPADQAPLLSSLNWFPGSWHIHPSYSPAAGPRVVPAFLRTPANATTWVWCPISPSAFLRAPDTGCFSRSADLALKFAAKSSTQGNDLIAAGSNGVPWFLPLKLEA